MQQQWWCHGLWQREEIRRQTIPAGTHRIEYSCRAYSKNIVRRKFELKWSMPRKGNTKKKREKTVPKKVKELDESSLIESRTKALHRKETNRNVSFLKNFIACCADTCVYPKVTHVHCQLQLQALFQCCFLELAISLCPQPTEEWQFAPTDIFSFVIYCPISNHVMAPLGVFLLCFKFIYKCSSLFWLTT